jgi:hypothetical protein
MLHGAMGTIPVPLSIGNHIGSFLFLVPKRFPTRILATGGRFPSLGGK